MSRGLCVVAASCRAWLVRRPRAPLQPLQLVVATVMSVARSVSRTSLSNGANAPGALSIGSGSMGVADAKLWLTGAGEAATVTGVPFAALVGWATGRLSPWTVATEAPGQGRWPAPRRGGPG